MRSDAALVLRARGGDETAVSELLDRLHGRIRLKALTYFTPDGTLDDLIQEGNVGLVKAIRDYRPDRDASFQHFAMLCIERQIITAVKAATRGKHQPLNQSICLDAPVREGDPDLRLGEVLPNGEVDVVERLTLRDELSAIAAQIRERLSSFEFECLIRHVEGLSYEDIAREVGVEHKKVDNALQRAWQKLNGERPAPAGTGYSCRRCGLPTRKRKRRGPPPVCLVCKSKPRAAARTPEAA